MKYLLWLVSITCFGQAITIDCGSATDQYFVGGATWATPNWVNPPPAPFNTLRYQTTFSYNIPLANGVYSISLVLIEPNKTAAGQRVFTVGANGQNSVPIDLFALTGADNIPYTLPMQALVGAGFLNLQFTSTVGNAVVTQIRATPITLGSLFGSVAPTALAANQLAIILPDGSAVPVQITNQPAPATPSVIPAVAATVLYLNADGSQGSQPMYAYTLAGTNGAVWMQLTPGGSIPFTTGTGPWGIWVSPTPATAPAVAK